MALKQLEKSRHKRPKTVAHVFICQRLLWQEEWRRRFEKEMDVWLLLYPGIAWPNNLYEPLVVDISFPRKTRRKAISYHGPWLVR